MTDTQPTEARRQRHPDRESDGTLNLEASLRRLRAADPYEYEGPDLFGAVVRLLKAYDQQAREVERLREMLDEHVSVFHEHPCHCEVCMVIHPPIPCCGDAGDCAEPCGTGGRT